MNNTDGLMSFGNTVRTIAGLDALQQLPLLREELMITNPFFLVSSSVRKRDWSKQ